jgi:hypothetical protein
VTVSADAFRDTFPEFSSSVDATILYWLSEGVATLNSRVLGERFDSAVMLFAAHNLTLSLRERRASQGGGLPGDPYMVVTSKAAGPVSKGMSPIGGGTTDPRGGEYNETSYGQRLWRILKANSLGGLYDPGCTGRLPGYPENRLMGWPGIPYGGRRW